MTQVLRASLARQEVPMATAPALIPAVLDFWFGSSDPAAEVELRNELWFNGGEVFDQECRRRFLPTLEALARGEGRSWLEHPGGQLASVIVLDQFSRNVFRDTPRAFAQDSRALAITLAGLEQGVDRQLGFAQRSFFYLPLEHSEDRAMQERSVAVFTALRDEAPPHRREAAQVVLDFALRHKEIIDRFGRYPHRNQVLGRTTTGEEFTFLRTPGSSF